LRLGSKKGSVPGGSRGGDRREKGPHTWGMSGGTRGTWNKKFQDRGGELVGRGKGLVGTPNLLEPLGSGGGAQTSCMGKFGTHPWEKENARRTSQGGKVFKSRKGALAWRGANGCCRGPHSYHSGGTTYALRPVTCKFFFRTRNGGGRRQGKK